MPPAVPLLPTLAQSSSQHVVKISGTDEGKRDEIHADMYVSEAGASVPRGP